MIHLVKIDCPECGVETVTVEPVYTDAIMHDPQMMELFEGMFVEVTESTPPQLLGWNLTCMHFVSGQRYEMLIMPGEKPRFVDAAR